MRNEWNESVNANGKLHRRSLNLQCYPLPTAMNKASINRTSKKLNVINISAFWNFKQKRSTTHCHEFRFEKRVESKTSRCSHSHETLTPQQSRKFFLGLKARVSATFTRPAKRPLICFFLFSTSRFFYDVWNQRQMLSTRSRIYYSRLSFLLCRVTWSQVLRCDTRNV